MMGRELHRWTVDSSEDFLGIWCPWGCQVIVWFLQQRGRKHKSVKSIRKFVTWHGGLHKHRLTDRQTHQYVFSNSYECHDFKLHNSVCTRRQMPAEYLMVSWNFWLSAVIRYMRHPYYTSNSMLFAPGTSNIWHESYNENKLWYSI